MSRTPNLRFALAIAGSLLLAAPAAAEGNPGPYWASLRATEVNMRVGPGEDYRINWVYHRQHLPVKVLREMEGWRLVQDQDGARGWVTVRLLSKQRGAVVIGGGAAEMREQASDSAKLAWRLSPGVVGVLGDCSGGWCKFGVAGRNGYVHEAALWGAGNP